DIKTRDRPHPNYRSASAAEKPPGWQLMTDDWVCSNISVARVHLRLSMKHYTSPLEGVLELEEREN
ncbi:unnamed protein product, partial [Durusdinium trenchii]